MKKIVFLLFICLNLFAKEVYDLRNEVVNTQIRLGTYEKLEDSTVILYADKLLPEEYAKISKIKDLVDRDDKKKELIQKAKTMVIKPQIGDELIFGNRMKVKYNEGKILMAMEDQWRILSSSDDIEIYRAGGIAFEPTTREVLKEIVNKGEITYEIVGTITKLDGHYFYLKDMKIKFFNDENKQIDIKELKSKIKMEYK